MPDPYETPLSPDEELSFRIWKAKYAPRDTGEDYDFRGAFKAGLRPDPENGHWPDTFKKPNHPTFSVESQYAKDAPRLAGRWEYGPDGEETWLGPRTLGTMVKGDAARAEEHRARRPIVPAPATRLPTASSVTTGAAGQVKELKMPDTNQLNEFLAKLTEGAQDDAERKRRIEQFAQVLNAVHQSPAAQMVPGSLPLRIANPDAPLINVARPVRAPVTPAMRPAPGSMVVAEDPTTERLTNQEETYTDEYGKRRAPFSTESR